MKDNENIALAIAPTSVPKNELTEAERIYRKISTLRVDLVAVLCILGYAFWAVFWLTWGLFK